MTDDIKPGRYEVLEYPELSLPNLHKVKVLAVFSVPKVGRIVRYRYNWPFPITREVLASKFASWVARREA